MDVVERLARAGKTPAESSRNTRGPQIKGLLRAREKIAMDYGGDVSRLRDILRASICLLYTSPSPRDQRGSRMPSSA